MQQEIVQIDNLHQLISTIVLHNPQRSLWRWTASHKQRVQRRRKRADVIRPWICDVSDFIHANRPQPSERHFRRHLAELRPQRLLQIRLNLSETPAAHQQWPYLGQADAPFTIHHAIDPLAHPAPQINREAIPWAHDVVRPRGNVHRNQLRIARPVFKYLGTESLWHRRTRYRLYIHIVKGWNVVVRARGSN